MCTDKTCPPATIIRDKDDIFFPAMIGNGRISIDGGDFHLRCMQISTIVNADHSNEDGPLSQLCLQLMPWQTDSEDTTDAWHILNAEYSTIKFNALLRNG